MHAGAESASAACAPSDRFGDHELPFGVFSSAQETSVRRRVGVAVGEHVLDLAPLLDDEVFAQPSLNAFLALGRARWHDVRGRLGDLLAAPGQRDRVRAHSLPLDEVRLWLPFEVGDFVDFYSSLEHATNAGRLLRPGEPPLRPNWRRLPVGYHGRAGTVVVSGTPVRRPRGQILGAAQAASTLRATKALDVEAEVGFVVGRGSSLGEPVPAAEFAEHVFGVVLLLDWSARDVQAFEAAPLGPFLAKSFATTISPWVLPLKALDAAWVDQPEQQPEPLSYLRVAQPAGLDVELQLRLNTTVVSRPRFATMYWTPAQQLAHLTVNGASLRTGDLFASGTVSGWDRGEQGCLLELTEDGREPIVLDDGSERGYLQDGDTVELRGWAPGPGGKPVWLGCADGRVTPALQ